MAFTTSKPTLGDWMVVDYDKDRDLEVKFRLRRLDEDTVSKIDDDLLKKFGKFDRNKNTGVKERVIPPNRRKAHDKERGFRLAAAAWTGTKNAWVELVTEDDVSLYSKALGKSGLEIGSEVCIDGGAEEDHPPAAIKRNVLSGMVGLVNRIVNYSVGDDFQYVDEDDSDEDDGLTTTYPEDEEEEDLKKTSSAPSSSVRAIRSESA